MERVLEVMAWFYEHRVELYDRMDDREKKTQQSGIHVLQVHVTLSKNWSNVCNAIHFAIVLGALSIIVIFSFVTGCL